LDDTDFHDLPGMREEWDKRILEEAKKKEDDKNRREEAK